MRLKRRSFLAGLGSAFGALALRGRDALSGLLPYTKGREAAAWPAPGWKMKPIAIPTRWTASVTPVNAWPEYPRPQMVRSGWQNLNGLWEYQITEDELKPQRYEGPMLVPYPLESALSGVGKRLRPDQRLWYRRTFTVKPPQRGERTLLHFDAVDFEATVFVNGAQLGMHRGGYQRFTLDATEALKSGENEVVVEVYDPTSKGPNPRGKQSLDAQWMMYTPSSGIWQTVWLEHVPASYIQRLTLTPDVDHQGRGVLHIGASLQGVQAGDVLEAVARSGNREVARETVTSATKVLIDRPRLWSPDDPYLYDLEVRLLRKGQPIDEVKSYFGLRKIEVKDDAKGLPRIFLNGLAIFNLGVADQGFWPDGVYTAPSDAALKFDLQAIKALGFNTVRKHIKIESERWYMHCDQLGLLVWQDMPSGNNDTLEGRAQFEKELAENLSQLHNHPSIVAWILFNEGWGAYDQTRLARWMKQADPSRLLDGHSGPYNQVEFAQYFKRLGASQMLQMLSGDVSRVLADIQATQYHSVWTAGDVADFHYYPGPRMPAVRPATASVTGEHGSFGVYIEGHVLDELKPVGLGVGARGLTPPQFLERYTDSCDKVKALEAQGLSGAFYFEIFDVEGEEQGFLTYDREITKVAVADIRRLNEKLVPRAHNYASATEGFAVKDANWIPGPQRYASLQSEFRGGRRDLKFLRRLALMAARQNHLAGAVAAGDEFITRAPQPWSNETWAVVAAVTCASKSKGFELLRTRTSEADAALGAQVAEKKLAEVIFREAIQPRLKDIRQPVDWGELEVSTVAQYGELGREGVYGGNMIRDWLLGDWGSFGQSYVRYFKTATPRSQYPVHTLAYQVLVHVNDTEALEAAIRVMKWSIDSEKPDSVFGRYDPTELDTYANLLYKVGRRTEALEWQRKAVDVSDGRDEEIAQHLRVMLNGYAAREQSPLQPYA